MPGQQTFVTRLLRRYHGGKPTDPGAIDLPTSDQVKYLCYVGLGPIAFQVYGEKFKQKDPDQFAVLQSADVTARVIYRQLEDAAVELVTELKDVGIRPTLLKGISTSNEFYIPHYLRLMGDVDILIQPSEVELVMAKVADLGYEITDEQRSLHRSRGHHHLPEARHPQTGMCIEVHTGLFGPEEFYSEEHVFQPEIIMGQCIEFDYREIQIARFTPEFQFIYTVSKWSVDRGWAVNLKNINDTIHILKKHQGKFDWPKMSTWFAASPHLFPITSALLHYLEQTDLVTISPQLRSLLAGTDRKLGPRTLKMLMWALHKYPFNAREKNNDDYGRWFAHAFWLYLSKPSGRDLGIPRELLRQLYTNTLYGQYSPVLKTLSALRAFVYRDTKK